MVTPARSVQGPRDRGQCVISPCRKEKKEHDDDEELASKEEARERVKHHQ